LNLDKVAAVQQPGSLNNNNNKKEDSGVINNRKGNNQIDVLTRLQRADKAVGIEVLHT